MILTSWFGSSVAWGAISFNSSSSLGVGTASSTKTISITVNSGSNKILLIHTGVEDGTDAERPITGITFNGDALTKVGSLNDNVANITSETWRLLNPSEGTFNAVITYTGAVDSSQVYSSVWNGVDQTTPFNATSSKSIIGDITVTSTSNMENVLVVGHVFNSAGNSLTLTASSTNQTSLAQLEEVAVDGDLSYKTVTSSGEYGLIWTQGGGTGRQLAFLSMLAPAQDAPTSTPAIISTSQTAGSMSITSGSYTIQ